LSDGDIASYIPALIDLRIRVFREFPYLYDGDEEYEDRYLRKYAASPRAVVVVALNGSEVVGVSTALPLTDADSEFQEPFLTSEIDPRQVFYFGESLLDARYRGRGIGHRFFDEREAFARKHGFSITAFCAVVRPSDHPRRPSNYRPHDAFWSKRGYVRRPDLMASYPWKDLGDTEETPKPLVFWLRDQC
jgi:GNAT superfamily N-acetyltransferase